MIIETRPLYEKVDDSFSEHFHLDSVQSHAGEASDKNPFSILQLFNPNNLAFESWNSEESFGNGE